MHPVYQIHDETLYDMNDPRNMDPTSTASNLTSVGFNAMLANMHTPLANTTSVETISFPPIKFPSSPPKRPEPFVRKKEDAPTTLLDEDIKEAKAAYIGHKKFVGAGFCAKNGWLHWSGSSWCRDAPEPTRPTTILDEDIAEAKAYHDRSGANALLGEAFTATNGTLYWCGYEWRRDNPWADDEDSYLKQDIADAEAAWGKADMNQIHTCPGGRKLYFGSAAVGWVRKAVPSYSATGEIRVDVQALVERIRVLEKAEPTDTVAKLLDRIERLETKAETSITARRMTTTQVEELQRRQFREHNDRESAVDELRELIRTRVAVGRAQTERIDKLKTQADAASVVRKIHSNQLNTLQDRVNSLGNSVAAFEEGEEDSDWDAADHLSRIQKLEEGSSDDTKERLSTLEGNHFSAVTSAAAERHRIRDRLQDLEETNKGGSDDTKKRLTTLEATTDNLENRLINDTRRINTLVREQEAITQPAPNNNHS